MVYIPFESFSKSPTSLGPSTLSKAFRWALPCILPSAGVFSWGKKRINA